MQLTESEIQILPDFIANQIAAGEVVQRPESVIKELVENALDAGADTIVVVVRGAGKQLIHVIDNGKGMSRADVLLACKRHATSKIRTTEDLQRIMTLGFRGEALASIASVAQVEIRTRREQDEIGWKLMSQPLAEPTIEPGTLEKGTQVLVKNLFYNVPARRKFLRTDLTEFRHISDTMLRFAIGNPHIRFVFYNEDSLVYDVQPSDVRTRVSNLLGERFAESLLPAEADNDLVKVTGFIGQPSFAQKTKAEQFLYLNRRTISSKQLSHAVFSAYEHLIDSSEYPPYVLFLEMDATRVDVNVHPQKHEVKFDDDRLVYNLLKQAATAALQAHDLTPQMQFRQQVASSPFERMSFGDPGKPGDTALVNRLTGEIMPDTPSARSAGPQSGQGERDFPPARAFNDKQPVTRREMSAYEALFGSDNRIPPSTSVSASRPPASEQPRLPDMPSQPGQHAGAKFFWQLHRKYILTQTDKGIAIIDQHVAHERILYERALKAINESLPYSQTLLFPVMLEMNVSEQALLTELNKEFLRLGFHYTLLDAGKVELSAVPLDVRTGQEETSLREILEQYREYEQIRNTDARDNLAASFACRASIKTGDMLSIPEMRQLVEDLYATSLPYVCPHGRPVVIEFPLQELDRRFGRTS
jgi:DNA mismatch repair protein MutL